MQQNEVVQKTPVVARVSSKVAKDASRAGGVTKRELGNAVRKLLTRLDASEKFQVSTKFNSFCVFQMPAFTMISSEGSCFAILFALFE